MIEPTQPSPPTGILVALVPAVDLASSAAFYCELLGLELRREFVVDGLVPGGSLSRGDLPYALNLRLKKTLPAGDANLAGEHPVIWRVADAAALEKFRQHAESLGMSPTAGRHDDGDLVCVVDPDGHDVLVGLPVRSWTEFQGYELTSEGYRRSHNQPLLTTTSSR
jgi:catechol 2,3-dioxygenase-like lactoylglutathione lyase family enzyme